MLLVKKPPGWDVKRLQQTETRSALIQHRRWEVKKCRVSTCRAGTLFCWLDRPDPRREPVQKKPGRSLQRPQLFQSFTLCHCRIFKIATKPCFDVWIPQWPLLFIYLFIYLFIFTFYNKWLSKMTRKFIYLFIHLFIYYTVALLPQTLRGVFILLLNIVFIFQHTVVITNKYIIRTLTTEG